MIWVLHSDIIPADLASNIWRNNAYKISYIRKERRANITERRRNGDWMALNGDWMVTEMYLPFSRLNGDWMAPFSFNGMVAFRLVREESCAKLKNKLYALKENQKNTVNFTLGFIIPHQYVRKWFQRQFSCLEQFYSSKSVKL